MGTVYDIKTGKPVVFAPPINMEDVDAAILSALAAETNAAIELESAIKAAAKHSIVYTGTEPPLGDVLAAENKAKAEKFAKYAPQYKNVKGSKFDKALTTTEIAARIRTDLKYAVKAGELPAMKYSVRKTDHNAIRVEMTSPPFGVLDELRVLNDAKHKYDDTRPWMSEEAARVLRAVEAVAEAYNYDRSDSMTDYFDVNFYLTVDYDHSTRVTERAAILANHGIDQWGKPLATSPAGQG